jgi:CDP-diacylglycerol--glycerol-3-phosphate 3-phosphatidyltransferase/cardiolipin synthase
MGHYRAADLWLVPSLLSLARLPLAAAFVLTIQQPALAFAVLCLAGLSDVLDGWYARRHGQVTATGTVVDPITDKLFVLTVVVTLVHHDLLSVAAVVLLSAREIGELPLVVWLGVSRSARRRKQETPAANVPGKLATVLQFTTVASALFESRSTTVLVWTTAAAGAVAAVVYWLRAFEGVRRERGSESDADESD